MKTSLMRHLIILAILCGHTCWGATNLFVSTYSNGVVREQGTYIMSTNGVQIKTGQWIKYWPSGSTNHIANYDGNGELHGVQLSCYPNGKPDTLVTFSNGIKDGAYKTWYSGGSKDCEQWYSNGVPHGEFIIWHNDSQMCDRATYVNGKVHGTNTSWNEKGIMTEEQVFSNGYTVVDKIWHDNGQLAVEMLYTSGRPSGIWRYYNSTGDLFSVYVWFDNGYMSHQRYSGGRPAGGCTYYDQSNHIVRITGASTNSFKRE